MSDSNLDRNNDHLKALQEERDLAEVGRAANSTLDLNMCFEAIAPALQPYVQHDRLAISLIHPDGTLKRAFVTGIGHNEVSSGTDVVSSDIQRARNEAGDIQLSGHSDHIRPGGMMDRLGLKSWAEVPIETPRGLIGYLAVRSLQPDAYKPEHLERLRRVANQIAPAITNAMLFSQTQEESKLGSVLAELGRITTSTLDISDVYDDVTNLIASVIPFDRLTVSSIDTEKEFNLIEYVTGKPMASQEVGSQNPLSEEVIRFLSQHKLPVIVDATLTKQFPFLKEYTELGIRNGLNSWFAAPFIWQGSPIGTLAFRHSGTDVYNESHLRNAGLIADQLSGAIANSLNYRNEREQNEIQSALAGVTMAISQDLDLHYIYDRLADELENLIPYDRLAITHYELDTRKTTIQYARGITLPGELPGDDVTNISDPAHWKQLVLAGEDENETDRAQQLRDIGLNSWVQSTIGTHPNGPDGFISLRSKNVDQYSDDDLELLKMFCERVTPALQNARRFEQAQELSKQRQIAKNLDEENIELQRQADARTEFLSSVSHELRTPLTAISAFTDVLNKNNTNNLSDRQMQHIAVIRRSTDSLTSLIDDLIDESKAVGGRLEITKEPFSVEETFTEFLATANQVAAQKDQEIFVIDECENCWIDADKNRILQVLNNLISNAHKYSEPNSQIRFSVKKEQGKLFISVVDQGIGISSNDIGNIFTPFFRSANDQTRSQSGTGLGLTIVKTIVELHGGEIQVQSNLGEGTNFSLWLPGVIEQSKIPANA